MAKTITVPLSRPVRVAGKDIAEVSVRESTIGDEEDALQEAVQIKRGNNPLSIEMLLLARMASLPYDVLRSMPSSDYIRLRDAYNSLSQGDREANPTSGTGTQQSS